ncbi:hypothetical protein [Microbispora bryophytorum]|uniref:hypothetical protein n=1 Tax=Microbispora bryophytorum TaxID=1460882 RepID=UPI0033EE931A
MVEEQNAKGFSLKALNGVSRLMREDLLDLACVSPAINPSALDLLQLTVAGAPMTCGVTSRQYSDVYNWLIWSISNSWEIEGSIELDVGRGYRALYSPVGSFGKQFITTWCTAMYTYLWHFGVLSEIGMSNVELAEHLIISELPHPDSLELAISLLSWAGRTSLPEGHPAGTRMQNIATALRQLVNAEDLPVSFQARAALATTFASDKITGGNRQLRAREVLQKFGRFIRADERLHLLAVSFENHPDDLLGSIAEIHEVVEECMAFRAGYFRSSQMINDADYHAASRERAATFGYVGGIVATLLEAGHGDEAAAILASWHGVPIRERRQDVLLQTTVNKAGGITWCAGKHVNTDPATPQVVVPLVSAMNAFLGTTVSVNDSTTFELKEPIRGRGTPIRDNAAEFERIAFEVLGLDQAIQTSAESSPNALLSLLPPQIPLQNMLLKYSGTTLPYAISLRPPMPDRPIRKALIWSGGIIGADEEAAHVGSIFRQHGIDVDIVPTEQMSRDRFLGCYADSTYDVIWVASHGLYDHLEVGSPAIPLPNDELVTLGDLVATSPPAGEGRRLLFLNICDGAASPTLGGLPEVGIAAATCSPIQAVISHLWPVDTFSVAPSYAILLASALAQDVGYFPAYMSATRTLIDGASAVSSCIQNLAPSASRLIDRLENHPPEMATIAGWGSPAFFE